MAISGVVSNDLEKESEIFSYKNYIHTQHMASRKYISLLKVAFKFEVSKSTIHRKMLKSNRTTFKKMLKKKFLREHHKAVHLSWAKKMLSYGDK